ncbi:MAG: AAA family ATPase [Ferruginibacter sp.]
MKYTKFEIDNFKGIDSIELKLTNNRVISLVGLNESGKTTIMEALNTFYVISKGKSISESEKNSLRPKGIDFTGEILLKATVEYEQDDLKKLQEYIVSLNLPYLIKT